MLSYRVVSRPTSADRSGAEAVAQPPLRCSRCS